MDAPSLATPSPFFTAAGSTQRWTGLAFLYWLACMTVLEPGNVAGMLDAGIQPDPLLEAVRLMVAALLGAAATPALLRLAQRFPTRRSFAWPGLAIQAAGVIVLALGLILVSCLLAAWLLQRQLLPDPADVARQLFANGLLLVLCLSGFLAIIHTRHGREVGRAIETRGGVAERSRPSSLTIRERGRSTVLDLAEVAWIETQGNYQALHTAHGVHLLRETSAKLAGQLDPNRFLRIHRRTIVALDRIHQVEPLSNGDALIRLSTGTELRLARKHRAPLVSWLRTQRWCIAAAAAPRA